MTEGGGGGGGGRKGEPDPRVAARGASGPDVARSRRLIRMKREKAASLAIAVSVRPLSYHTAGTAISGGDG